MKHIVQIEFTNHCNRRCSYCGIPIMQREKGFITKETVLRCIEVLQGLNQTVVGITHYGESTLHRNFIDLVKLFNDHGIKPWLNTNGDLWNDDFIQEVKDNCEFTHITVSGHMPKQDRINLWIKLSEAGYVSYWQNDFTEESTLNLAGQVNTPSFNVGQPILDDPANHCKFLVEENAIVLWNGDLAPCCVDFEGIGKFGNIFDEAVLNLKPHVNRLCLTCPGHPGSII